MGFSSVAWLPVIGILIGPVIVIVGIMFCLSVFAPDLAARAKDGMLYLFLGTLIISVGGALATAFLTAAGGGAAAGLPVIPLIQAASSLM